MTVTFPDGRTFESLSDALSADDKPRTMLERATELVRSATPDLQSLDDETRTMLGHFVEAIATYVAHPWEADRRNLLSVAAEVDAYLSSMMLEQERNGLSVPGPGVPVKR